jgi:YVTN family beta-propeller protein
MAANVNEKTNRIYVANSGNDNVSVIDGASETVITTIPIGYAPMGIALNEKGNRVYVANRASNDVSIVDGANDTVIDVLSVGLGPIGISVNELTDYIYVADSRDDTVSVIQDELPCPDWDLNCDGRCDVIDFSYFGSHWNETGPPGWIRADWNKDGRVDALDFSGIFAAHWNETW